MAGDLGYFARVALTTSGPEAKLTRPGHTITTRQLGEVRAWAQRYPEHYTEALLDFEQALTTYRPPPNPTVATVDEALQMTRRLAQGGDAA